MKFRGLMNDYNAMKDFMHIVNCLSKLSKECILRILPNTLYFIITDEENGPRRPFIWCELTAEYYFREYLMNGISAEHQEIFLSFSPQMLAKSVNSVKLSAKTLKIKLTNKQTPCLTLEIEMAPASGSQQNRLCVHDIPVEVISHKHWGDYVEPKFQEFHVTIELPSLKSIRNIVDRMKTMSHYLIVSANKSGRLTLKIETNLVNVSAHFPNLSVESFAEGINCDPDSQLTCLDSEEAKCQSVSASIDIKKFVSFLTAMHITSNKIICSIVHGKMVKLLIDNSGIMTLQCFLTEQSP